MRHSLRRWVVLFFAASMAACTSVEDAPGVGGNGGIAGAGGSAGTGGVAGAGGFAGTGGIAGAGGSGGQGGSAPAPTVALSATPGSVATGDKAELSWSTTHAENCFATEGWGGPKATSGGAERKRIYEADTFALTCNGEGGTASKEIDVGLASSQLMVTVEMNLYLVVVGQSFDLNITVSNPNTTDAVAGAVATFRVPDYVDIDKDELPDGVECEATCALDEIVTINLGTVEPGEVEQRTVSSTVGSGIPPDHDIEFEVSASGGEETNATAATETVTQGESDFVLLLSQEPGQPVAGTIMVYTFEYENAGTAALPEVVLFMTLPEPVQFMGASDDGVHDGEGMVTWAFDELAAGEKGQVQALVDVDRDLPPGAQLLARAGATVQGTEVKARATSQASVNDGIAQCMFPSDCNPEEVCSAGSCTVPLLAAIYVDADPALPDELIRVSVTITNATSTEAVNDVHVEVPLPAGIKAMESNRVSAGGTCTYHPTSWARCYGGESLNWDVGTLEPGESRVVSFEPIASGSEESLVFPVSVTSSSGVGAFDSAIATVAPGPALTVRLVASSNPVEQGEKLTYTLHYANQGAVTINAASLEFTVPDGATLDAESTDRWNLGSLSAGEGGARVVTVNVTAAEGQQLLAEALVYDTTTPTMQARASVGTPVAESALLAHVEVNPDPSEQNETLNVSVTVTNPTAQPVASAHVEVRLPNGLKPMTDPRVSDGGSCTYHPTSWAYCDPGENLTWDLGDLAAGETRVVSFEPIVHPNTRVGFLQHYQAEVRAAGEPPVLAGATSLVQELGSRSLNVRIVESSNPVDEGGKLTYTLHYSNQSEVTINNATLQLMIANGATLDLESFDTWDVGSLGQGEGGTRQATVTATAVRGEQIRAVALVYDTDDPSVQARAIAQTPIGRSALLAHVEVNPDPSEQNETIYVSVTVTNPTNQAVNSAHVEMRLPRGIQAMASTRVSEGGTCTYHPTSWAYCDAGENLDWDLGDLAARETRVVSFEPILHPDATVGYLQVYEAEVRANQEPSVLASATTLVQKATTRPLGLRVVESANPVRPGDKLTYTMHYSNQGTSTLDAVSLDFSVPEGATLDTGSTNSWTLGTLSPGEGGTRQCTVVVDAAAGEQLRAEVAVHDPSDPAVETRSVVQTPVDTSALVAFVEVNPDPAEQGELSNVSVTVSNRSSTQTANSVSVEARVPRGTTAIAKARASSGATCTYHPTSWAYCDAGENVNWDLGDLAPGESRVVSFEPVVHSATRVGFLQLYDVEVRAHQEPAVLAAATTLIQKNDTRALTLRVVEDSNPVDAGQLLTYTLHYANQSGFTINDARLALTSLEGAMVDGGSTDSWMLGSLGAGQSGTRQATVLVTAAAGEPVRAEAVVYNDDDPTVEARSTVQTPVVAASTVEAMLTVDTNTAQRGEQVRVSLQVTNPSATTPQNQVRVEAQLPIGITAIASTRASIDAECTYPTWTYCDWGETVYWTIETLAPLESTAMDLWYDPIVATGADDGDILFFEAQTTVGGVPRSVAGATMAVDGP